MLYTGRSLVFSVDDFGPKHQPGPVHQRKAYPQLQLTSFQSDVNPSQSKLHTRCQSNANSGDWIITPQTIQMSMQAQSDAFPMEGQSTVNPKSILVNVPYQQTAYPRNGIGLALHWQQVPYLEAGC